MERFNRSFNVFSWNTAKQPTLIFIHYRSQRIKGPTFITQDFVFLNCCSFDSISMAHLLKGSDFTVILHGSSACNCGVGTLVPSLLAHSKGKQQKCCNSLTGKAGVRLVFYLLGIVGIPGLAQGTLLLPWPNAEVEDFLSSFIMHVLFNVFFSSEKHFSPSESQHNVSDSSYLATALLCRYHWLISFWFTEACLKHGAVPLQRQWITSVQTRTKLFSALTVRLMKGEA